MGGWSEVEWVGGVGLGAWVEWGWVDGWSRVGWVGGVGLGGWLEGVGWIMTTCC